MLAMKSSRRHYKKGKSSISITNQMNPPSDHYFLELQTITMSFIHFNSNCSIPPFFILLFNLSNTSSFSIFVRLVLRKPRALIPPVSFLLLLPLPTVVNLSMLPSPYDPKESMSRLYLKLYLVTKLKRKLSQHWLKQDTIQVMSMVPLPLSIFPLPHVLLPCLP